GGRGVHLLAHAAAGLEADGTLGWHGHALEGLGVLGGAGGAVLDLEDAEVAELDPVALPKLVHDLVEEVLEHVLHRGPLHLVLRRDAVHQDLLRDRVHRPLTFGHARGRAAVGVAGKGGLVVPGAMRSPRHARGNPGKSPPRTLPPERGRSGTGCNAEYPR